jgi:hypothetical protein
MGNFYLAKYLIRISAILVVFVSFSSAVYAGDADCYEYFSSPDSEKSFVVRYFKAGDFRVSTASTEGEGGTLGPDQGYFDFLKKGLISAIRRDISKGDLEALKFGVKTWEKEIENAFLAEKIGAAPQKMGIIVLNPLTREPHLWIASENKLIDVDGNSVKDSQVYESPDFLIGEHQLSAYHFLKWEAMGYSPVGWNPQMIQHDISHAYKYFKKPAQSVVYRKIILDHLEEYKDELLLAKNSGEISEEDPSPAVIRLMAFDEFGVFFRTGDAENEAELKREISTLLKTLDLDLTQAKEMSPRRLAAFVKTGLKRIGPDSEKFKRITSTLRKMSERGPEIFERQSGAALDGYNDLLFLRDFGPYGRLKTLVGEFSSEKFIEFIYFYLHRISSEDFLREVIQGAKNLRDPETHRKSKVIRYFKIYELFPDPLGGQSEWYIDAFSRPSSFNVHSR